MTSAVLAATVYAWLCLAVPPDLVRLTAPEAVETVEDKRVRYQSIAEDIAEAVLAEPTADPRRASALLVAIAVRESGLAKDVDAAECHRARVARGGCDGGRARTLWQLQGVRPETRREAASMALRAIRRSLNACRALPAAERLAAYAAGTCSSAAGRRLSRDRVALQQRLLASGTP